MNQRIRELSEQALEIVSKKRTLKDCLLDRVWDPHEYDRVFTELIVAECLEACSRANDIRHFVPPTQEQVVLSCMREIEEHFGVKK